MPLSPEELTAAHAKVMFLLRVMLTTISAAELRGLLDEVSRMHAWMPIVDPTRYRAIVDTMGGHEEAIRALYSCRTALVRILGDEAPELLALFEREEPSGEARRLAHANQPLPAPIERAIRLLAHHCAEHGYQTVTIGASGGAVFHADIYGTESPQ
jgi:hypothetical protein